MEIQESVRKSEGLSKEEAERLEGLLDEVVKSNPSMPPEIYYADGVLEIDTSEGGQSIDADVVGESGMKALKPLIKKFDNAKGDKAKDKAKDAIYKIIGNYMEAGPRSNLYSIEISSGWIAHLSMPGYMDQTEPQRYDTLKEAVEALHEQYADFDS
jgi:hypothetical protein